MLVGHYLDILLGPDFHRRQVVPPNYSVTVILLWNKSSQKGACRIPPALAMDEIDLLCQVCHELFTLPKLLPCHHTFCQQCLQDLLSSAQDQDQPLLCPTCRASVTLPPGGVPDLQTNFYLLPLLSGNLCPHHPGKKLEFVCRQDGEALCINCSLVDHSGHPVHDLPRGVKEARTRLKKHAEELKARQDRVQAELRQFQDGWQSFQRTIRVLQETVRMREEGLVAMVRSAGREALQQLENMAEESQRDYQEARDRGQEKAVTLQHLAREVQATLDQSGALPALALSRDLRFKQGSCRNSASASDLTIDLQLNLVLGVDPTPQIDLVQRLVGRVMTHTAGSLKEVFRCKKGEDVEVNALCVCSNGYLILAYSEGRESEGWVAKFTPKGDAKDWAPQAVLGRVCLAELPSGLVLVEGPDFPPRLFHSQFVQPEDAAQDESDLLRPSPDKKHDIYSKLKTRFCLRLSPNGACHVRSLDLTKEEPATNFQVDAENPVSMDASQDGQTFAVLEENAGKVQIYRLNQATPASAYQGCGSPLQPTDLCFIVIGGNERLVVADRLSHSLHVIDVTEDCALIGQIGGGHLSKAPPTALCADDEGQLWIGCQGGYVYMYA